MSAGRFEIRRSNAGHRVVLIASNGEPLSVSEVLSSEEAAHGNIHAQLDAIEDATGQTFGVAHAPDVRVVDERDANEVTP